MSKTEIILGDCLEIMKSFSDNHFDLVLTDPPYGVTGLTWDNNDLSWVSEACRLLKPDGTLVVFATQPFTSKLIYENKSLYKYSWVWNKVSAGNPFTAKYAPLKVTEDICVFGKKPKYFPQMVRGKMKAKGGKAMSKLFGVETVAYRNDLYYPKNLITFTNNNNIKKYHPTQKPVELMHYLISTYSNEGDKVLDPFAGSGTTLRAAKDLNRSCIGIDISKEYCDIAESRLKQEILL